MNEKTNNSVLAVSVFAQIDNSNDPDIDSVVGYLRKKHIAADSFYVERGGIERDTQRLYGLKPYDVYVFYMRLENLQICFQLSRSLKQKNSSICICAVGDILTGCYKDILRSSEDIDYIVLGSPNEAVGYIACQFRGGEIDLDQKKNIVSHNCFTDRCAYESFEYHQNYVDDYFETHPFSLKMCYCLLTKNKGCSGGCTFCIEKKHDRFSYASVDSIYRTIVDRKRDLQITHFFILDDNLFDGPDNIAKKRIWDLCGLLMDGKTEVTFSFLMRPDSFRDTQEDNDLLERMYEAGFIQGSFGAEAGNEADLKLYGKGCHVQNVKLSYELLKRHHINARTGFIMINPYSTCDSLRDNYNLLREFQSGDLFRFAGAYLSLYKNTSIYYKLKRDHMLREPYDYLDDRCYIYRNDEAAEIARFLEEYFWNDHRIWGLETADSLGFIFDRLFRFSDRYFCYQDQVQRLTDEYSYLLTNYFELLYRYFDIDKCIGKIQAFKKDLIGMHGKIASLENRLMVDYLKGRKKDAK